jgi:hypothetical protein
VGGAVDVDGARWRVTLGTLTPSDDATYLTPWVAAGEGDDFLNRIDAGTAARFNLLGPIKVGVKTTADKVFIRRSWDELRTIAPEPELIHRLISSDTASRWSCRESEMSILYPYDMQSLKRSPVDLDDYPRTRAYLEANRDTLASRKYVIEGGREWWEIWVPQKPAAWAGPKIVFPDISVDGRFAVDRSGALVNGNCYWIPIEDGADDLAYLAVAVANSTLATRYYDARFGNKLYAGRRRFISQYVSEFPIPDPALTSSRRAVALARELESLDDLERIAGLEAEANKAVWSAFGLEEP